MAEYVRTAIRRLAISGFRSIRSLELRDIPDLVVLHGPNGAGKSNLLLAAQLVLRAAALAGELPVYRESASRLSLAEADKSLGLRPDDFHFGAPPEIRVRLDVTLGTKAAEILAAPGESSLGCLKLELVVQQTRPGELFFWFPRADIDDTISLGRDPDPERNRLRETLVSLREQEAEHRAQMSVLEKSLAASAAKPAVHQTKKEIELARAAMVVRRESLRRTEAQARAIEKELGSEALLAERIRSTVLPQLLQVSPAYRVPGGVGDPEAALFHSFISEDPLQRLATQRLGRRLAKARLFGVKGDAVALLPVDSATYGEKQVRFNHPTHGELPLRNLGSGEQQVVFMLAQRVITPFPIALLEEPEAHLHTSLMEPFADVLTDSVEGEGGVPDVDQLFVATHHHHFALALEYFDVKGVDGATQVERLPRAKAARHFWEPGPIWEALRQLAKSAKESAVVFRDADGQPVTAGQVLESIEKDPDQKLAKQYANAMTEAMVLAMRQRAENPK